MEEQGKGIGKLLWAKAMAVPFTQGKDIVLDSYAHALKSPSTNPLSFHNVVVLYLHSRGKRGFLKLSYGCGGG